MTFLEWRKDVDLVNVLAEALRDNPILSKAFACMAENGPQNRPTPIGISPTLANIKLGQIKGYAEYPATLFSLATHYREEERIEATYGAEET